MIVSYFHGTGISNILGTDCIHLRGNSNIWLDEMIKYTNYQLFHLGSRTIALLPHHQNMVMMANLSLKCCHVNFGGKSDFFDFDWQLLDNHGIGA
jgi:hypothetical protein